MIHESIQGKDTMNVAKGEKLKIFIFSSSEADTYKQQECEEFIETHEVIEIDQKAVVNWVGREYFVTVKYK